MRKILAIIFTDGTTPHNNPDRMGKILITILTDEIIADNNTDGSDNHIGLQ